MVYDQGMKKDAERRLRERLARVEALHAGATTPGEKAAARKALDRVIEQLSQAMANDEVRRFVHAHVASLGVAEPQHVRKVRGLPTRAELDEILQRWRSLEWTGSQVQAWASHVVDSVVLPSDPTHPAAARGEVLLQLSSWDLGHLQPTDVPRVQAFLGDGDWASWFDLIAEAAQRAGRRRRAG